MKTDEKFIVISILVLLIYGLFIAGDTIYINDMNEVVQIGERELVYPRELNEDDLSSRVLNIRELEK